MMDYNLMPVIKVQKTKSKSQTNLKIQFQRIKKLFY
jgi:hypothetical protein